MLHYTHSVTRVDVLLNEVKVAVTGVGQWLKFRRQPPIRIKITSGGYRITLVLDPWTTGLLLNAPVLQNLLQPQGFS